MNLYEFNFVEKDDYQSLKQSFWIMTKTLSSVNGLSTRELPAKNSDVKVCNLCAMAAIFGQQSR